MKTVEVISAVSTTRFVVSMHKSFTRMITTPLGSRVRRPKFGSKMHELIDKMMDERWLLLCKTYLFECFLDENNQPWDKRFKPKSVEIIKVDTISGYVTARVNFDGFSVTTDVKGF